jgi:ribosomal protein S12 methylthiotransferase
VAIRSSFIVGFPGETDKAHRKLLEFIAEQQFERVGAFTFSREENTAAFDLANQVPERVKRERRAAVMELQAGISHKRNQGLVGNELEVLIEDSMAGGGRRRRGRSAHQAPEIDGMIMLKGEGQPGEFARARITRALTYDLHGEIVGETRSS